MDVIGLAVVTLVAFFVGWILGVQYGSEAPLVTAGSCAVVVGAVGFVVVLTRYKQPGKIREDLDLVRLRAQRAFNVTLEQQWAQGLRPGPKPLPTGDQVMNLFTGELEWDRSKFVGNRTRQVLSVVEVRAIIRDAAKLQALKTVLLSGDYPTQRALVPPFTAGARGTYARSMRVLELEGLAFQRPTGVAGAVGWAFTPRFYKLLGVAPLPYLQPKQPFEEGTNPYDLRDSA